MRLIISSFICLQLLIYSNSYAQIEQYSYKRELKGISGQWHKIILPDEIFGNISQDLSDIRIIGITSAKDTVEVPYLLRLTSGKIESKEVVFKTLNMSHNDKGYFFTFEIPTSEPINQIKLGFKQQNFDWRVKLEGSQNQQEWYTLTDDYRILSVKNELIDFQFTKVTFPNSKYRFLRLHVESKEKPELTAASISQHLILDGNYRTYSIRKTKRRELKETRQTEIDIDLQLPVPVSSLKIRVENSFDYYRNLTVKYLADSMKTEKGWKYSYNTLTCGTLSSIGDNEFKFNSTIVQKIKLLIHNQDNQPLIIDTILVKGYIHELVARFTEPASYFLVYGNESVPKPDYDITRFTDKIPEELNTLELGAEQIIEKRKVAETEPLFKNKNWLWAIMTLIILVLGWVSVKMIQKK
jgi:hypothetical protein